MVAARRYPFLNNLEITREGAFSFQPPSLTSPGRFGGGKEGVFSRRGTFWETLQLNEGPKRGGAIQYANYDESVEEETLFLTMTQEFYPGHIGEVFQRRYQIIGKLGFRANVDYLVLP
jgi:hypothetical protein